TCTLLVTASLVAVRGMRRALDGSYAGIKPQGVMLAATSLPEGLEEDRALETQKEMVGTVRNLAGGTAVGAVRETPMSWPRRVVPVYRPGTTEFTPENQALATHVYPMSPGLPEGRRHAAPRRARRVLAGHPADAARGDRQRNLRAEAVGRGTPHWTAL